MARLPLNDWSRKRAVCFRIYLGLAVLLSLGSLCLAEPPPAVATNLWDFSFTYPNSTLPSGSSTATPAIGSDGTLYVGSFDGTFFALTPAGQIKWKFKAGREVHSSAAVGDDGTIYFGSRDGKLYALTLAGKLKWTFATAGWVDASPALGADGTIYFGSWDKHFYAVNPDGSLKWKFTTGALVDSSPAIAADGTIYFGSHDQKFYALTPDGRARWTYPTGGGIISSPALGADGAIYFSSLDGNLYALNPDGTRRWQTHTGGSSASSPVLDETGRIYLSAGHTQCFSPAGQFLWEWVADADLGISAAAARGQVYLSRTYNEIDSFTADRRLLWTSQLTTSPTSSLVIGPDGTLYASCDRHLSALRPPNPVPPAGSSWPMFRANARHTGRVGTR